MWRLRSRRLASVTDLAVVRIQATRQRPSWTVPWQMRPIEAGSGTGSIIHNSDGVVRILTAAHVVADSTYITIQRNTDHFDSEKFPAKVIAQFHDTDLALIEILDRHACVSEFSSIDAMTVAPSDVLPSLRSKVNVVGYPVGGDRLSVTEGVVSRVDIAKYSHSGRFAASFTVDAAINAGNSGGPIVDPANGSILGVAFQKLVGSGIENQGHGVPSYLIHRFLKNPQSVHSLPCLGIAVQPLDSPALREYMGAPNGVLVNWSRNKALMPNDVIVSINGHRVDNHGLTQFLGRRIHFSALIHEKFVADSVRLEVIRKKKLVTVESPLVASSSIDLVPSLAYGVRPTYLVVGGLVFQPLSLDYLQGWNERDRPPHLQDLLSRGKVEDNRSQAIVLTNVLASRCNAGYSSGWVGGPVLKAVNGEAVKDMKHFESIVDRVLQTEEFIKFTITGYVDDQLVVQKTSEVLRDELLIQATYDIPKMRHLV